MSEAAGFKCHVEHRFQMDAFAIWFTLRDRIVRFDAEGRRTIETFDPSIQPEPSLVIPGDLLEQLVAAASDVVPPSAALSRHLADAITVRDRLLTMVERP